MKQILFPRIFRPIGWCLFVIGVVLGILFFTSEIRMGSTLETIVNDVTIISFALGAVFIVGSREKTEDEMTSAIRLRSLLKALYIYLAILIVATIAVNGIAYFYVMLVNLVLMPVIYVIVFQIEMSRYYKLADDEEQN